MSLGISYYGYRSGFPFPMRTGDVSEVGIETEHPLGFTFPQFEQLFWKAAEFQLVADFETSETVGSDLLELDVDTAAYPPDAFTHLLGVSTPVVAEWELITPIPDNSNTAVYTDATYPPAFTYDEWTIGTADLGATSGTAYGYYLLQIDFDDTLLYDGKFWPKLLFRMYCPTSHLSGGLPLTHNASTEWPIAGSGQSFTLTICGASVEIGLGKNLTSPGESADVFGSGSITIAPSAFWEYGGKFHPTTGARL
jgi:hypothetical protein